jgi:hypothetical protein
MKGKTMTKRKGSIERKDKPEASQPVHASSHPSEDEQLRLEYIEWLKSVVSSSEELYFMMKLLSLHFPFSAIDEIFAQKVKEMDQVLTEMKLVSSLLEGLKPEWFSIPEWTINMIKNGIWKYRAERLLGEIVEFHTFQAFIEAPPPMGLGSSLEKLRELCSGSEEALRMIDKVVGE